MNTTTDTSNGLKSQPKCDQPKPHPTNNQTATTTYIYTIKRTEKKSELSKEEKREKEKERNDRRIVQGRLRRRRNVGLFFIGTNLLSKWQCLMCLQDVRPHLRCLFSRDDISGLFLHIGLFHGSELSAI